MTKILYEDVNLDEFNFENNNQDIYFKFIDTNRGSHVGGLKCRGVIYSYYLNCLDYSDENDRFPVFVSEVKKETINDISIEKMKAIGFYKWNEVIDLDEYFLLSVEGGQIEMNVVCKEVVSANTDS